MRRTGYKERACVMAALTRADDKHVELECRHGSAEGRGAAAGVSRGAGL